MRKAIYAVLLATSMTVMTACASGQGGTSTPTETTGEVKEINLGDIRDAVKKAYGENYIPSMEYDEQMMSDLFGIGKDMYTSYVAEGPMMSTHVDTFVAVEAKKDQADAVEKALTDYRERQVNDSLQYPMNIAKVQASEVVRHGDYVFFVMLGTPDMEEEEKGEDAALASAKENNKIAIDLINGYFQ